MGFVLFSSSMSVYFSLIVFFFFFWSSFASALSPVSSTSSTFGSLSSSSPSRSQCCSRSFNRMCAPKVVSLAVCRYLGGMRLVQWNCPVKISWTSIWHSKTAHTSGLAYVEILVINYSNMCVPCLVCHIVFVSGLVLLVLIALAVALY